jgi:endonuclease YncB( thermonuclease family)
MIANIHPSCWLAAIAAGAFLLAPAASGTAHAQGAAKRAPPREATREATSEATGEASSERPAPRRSRRAAAGPACRYDAVGSGTVATVLDGRSFVLEDGREVRLDGIEVPPVAGSGVNAERAAAGRTAKAALEELVLHRPVALHARDAAADRYGRIVAQADVFTDSGPRPVVEELLTRGQARMAADTGDAACAAALLEREARARAAKLGLWSDPYYSVRAAGDLAGLLAERGRFSVVEGTILSVRESGGIIYMNFGRRWSQALTVTIGKRREAIFTAAGLDPKRLGNRRVRVRGWIEERNGPRIEATRPEQIEIAERH